MSGTAWKRLVARFRFFFSHERLTGQSVTYLESFIMEYTPISFDQSNKKILFTSLGLPKKIRNKKSLITFLWAVTSFISLC